MRAYRGFTLIELMIVVAIIAILVAVGYPAYTDQVRKTRRAEAKATLQQIMNHQERYYTSNNSYAANLSAMDPYANNTVSSPEGWYDVTAAACGGGITECVLLTAAPQNDQAGDPCGNFTLNSRGQRNVSGAGNCW